MPATDPRSRAASPCKAMARMTDDELRALWMYLRTVPPVEPPAS